MPLILDAVHKNPPKEQKVDCNVTDCGGHRKCNFIYSSHVENAVNREGREEEKRGVVIIILKKVHVMQLANTPQRYSSS